MSLKTMIVDDDPFTRGMLELSLSLEGFSVSTAADGPSALAAVGADRPDVILLDVMMPAMNGYEVIEHLRKDEQHRATPVIFLTANASDEDVWEGWTRGADSYITKPLDMDMLVQEIERLTTGRCAA